MTPLIGHKIRQNIADVNIGYVVSPSRETEAKMFPDFSKYHCQPQKM